MACKDEGQRLELKEKEKWYVDEVKRVKAIVGTVVWTRTRLLKVEYKQWKSLLQRECHGDLTNLHNFTSTEVSLEEREILNCGDGLVPRRYGITGARKRQREM